MFIRETEEYPCSLKGLIYPKDDRGWILPNSEPEIYFEIHYKAGIKHQELNLKVIEDLNQSLAQLRKQGIE